MFPGWTVRYAGIGGQTSEQIEARLTTELVKGCTTVVILAGTNDLVLNASATPAAVARMAAAAQAKGCSPVLFRIPRIALPGMPEVAAWNTGISAFGRPTLDGYTVSAEPSNMRGDGVHFGDAGYGQLSATLH